MLGRRRLWIWLIKTWIFRYTDDEESYQRVCADEAGNELRSTPYQPGSSFQPAISAARKKRNHARLDLVTGTRREGEVELLVAGPMQASWEALMMQFVHACRFLRPIIIFVPFQFRLFSFTVVTPL